VVLDATTGASVAQRNGAQSIIAFDAQGTRLLLFDPAVRRPLAWSYEQDQLESAAFEALRDLASASINSREGLFAWKDGGEFDPGIVHVYGLNTGAERYSFGAMGPAAPVFSADGRWLLTLDDASTVGVRDARTGAYQAALQGNSDSIYVIACVSDRAATSGASSDHGRIVTGAKNGSIRLWDADSFEEVAEFHEHRSYVKSLAISPDGRTMVSASGDQTVRVWDTRPLRERLPARAR
jgi:WD40 repeat protein